MTNQLQHIAGLYLRNRQVWWVLGWTALMALPALVMLAPDAGFERTGLVATQIIGLPVGGCVFILFIQAKWQFCSSRARLLPGYAAPHLLVLLVIAVAFIGLLPLVPGLAGYNALGAAAYAAAIAATFLWSLQSNLLLANLVALTLLFSVYNSRVAAFWLLPSEAARWLPIHLAILAAGWLAIAAWLWRLSRLREDAEDYFIPAQAQVGAATRTARSLASKAAVRQLLKSKPTRWICDWWHDRLTGVPAPTAAARQRLLRYGFAATPSAALALWMALVFFLILWGMSASSIYRRAPNQTAIVPALNIFIIMPGVSALNLLTVRRTFMAQELLLPLTRRQYIDGLLRACAKHAAIAWIVVQAAMLALLAVIAPAVLNGTFVAALTALSLGAQIYAFGATSWVAQTTQGGKKPVLTMAALIPALIAVSIGLSQIAGPGVTRAQFDLQTERQIEKSLAGLPPSEPGRLDPGRAPDPYAKARARISARQHAQAEANWRRQQPTPAAAWIAAASLTILGAALLIHSRRRWLELELG